MPFSPKPLVLLTALWTAYGLASAQTAPDAGRVLQQEQAIPQLPVQRDVSIQVPTLLDRVAPGGPKAGISRLRFSGNAQLSEEQLRQSLPTDALAQPMDLSEMQALADVLSATYRRAGFPFARVFVPAQNMAQGELLLQVVEGRYGKVTASGDAAVAAAARPYLNKLVPGEVIQTPSLERTTLLLSDLPGVVVAPLIRPGQEFGTGDLDVNVQRSAGINGEIGLDNHGNRYSGAQGVRAKVQWDSPFTTGDQIQLRTLYTNENMWMGSLNYSLPLGADGLRANVGAQHTYYELGQEFASAQANGTANVVSAGVIYPILRSQQANMALSLQWQHKRLNDRQDVANTQTDKRSDVLPLTLNFDARDAWLGGGITYGMASLTHGRLRLDSAQSVTDASTARTARTAGSFNKINLDVARAQALPLPKLSAYVRGAAQWTGDKNLDSSEGFGLGGPNGVRAYPVGEGYGDKGWLAQAELRYRLNNWMPFVFYDAGQATIKAAPWTAGNNTRKIAGGGVGVRYQQGAVGAEAHLAWRSHGGASQADTQDNNPRLWFSVDYRF